MCWHHSQQWAAAQGLPQRQQLVPIKSRTAVQKTMKNIPSCRIQIQAGLWAITTVQEYSLLEELSCSDLQGRHFVWRTKQNKMPLWVGLTGFLSLACLCFTDWLQACCTCCMNSLNNIFLHRDFLLFPLYFCQVGHDGAIWFGDIAVQNACCRANTHSWKNTCGYTSGSSAGWTFSVYHISVYHIK